MQLERERRAGPFAVGGKGSRNDVVVSGRNAGRVRQESAEPLEAIDLALRDALEAVARGSRRAISRRVAGRGAGVLSIAFGATQRLREYILKGFTLDDEHLKKAGGGDHFRELLDRIRDIRSSERVFWRQVLDIYALSEDYDPRAETSKLFFQTVQNKMHWAVSGKTAAEIVHSRDDAASRSWVNPPRRCALGPGPTAAFRRLGIRLS